MEGVVEDNVYIFWKQFADGWCDTSSLKGEVSRSWKRCRTLGLDPYGRPPNIQKNKMNRLIERNRQLLEVGLPVINLAHELIQGTGFIVVLTDGDGNVLTIQGDEQVIQHARNNNFDVCANRAERLVGTNAIGLAIIENKPIQVVGAEHYNIYHHKWTCSAAPIHDQGKKMVGVVNLSGHYALNHRHTLGMVASLSKEIEKEFYILENENSLRVANQHLKTIMDSISDGVIAINQDGLVMAANGKVVKMFGLENITYHHTKIENVFKGTLPLQRLLEIGEEFSDREYTVSSGFRTIPCLVTGRQIRDKGGQTVGFVSILKEKEKMHRMINRYIGAKATFTFHDIIGKSNGLKNAIDLAKSVSHTDARVILEGESGTGKEMFAQAIHNNSKRSVGPFVAVNCGAIPRELVESELFGYSDGAFTGAKKGGKPGKFELADGGTLFLDEVSSMSLEMQLKLLRVLQQNELTRVGGIETIPVDVRLISASNKPLERLIQEDLFRGDLFYRLGVVVIKIPPLRERKEDILELLPYLLEKMSIKMGINMPGIEPDLMRALCEYNWVGNVRELENYIERAIIIAQGDMLTYEHFPSKIFKSSGQSEGPESPKGLEQAEIECIREALSSCDWNISRTAQNLGISRNTLYSKLKKYNIAFAKD